MEIYDNTWKLRCGKQIEKLQVGRLNRGRCVQLCRRTLAYQVNFDGSENASYITEKRCIRNLEKVHPRVAGTLCGEDFAIEKVVGH